MARKNKKSVESKNGSENNEMYLYMGFKAVPELHALIGQAADKSNLPMNEWVVQVLANHLGRPELGHVPRVSCGGRPRRYHAPELAQP